MSVRRVQPHDAAVLRSVRLAALEDAPAAFGSTHAAEVVRPDHEWAERAKAASRGSRRATFFAEEAGAVVGLVGAYRSEGSDAVELVSMWVAPWLRRTGTGRALLEAVVSWAEVTDGGDVTLWVTAGNTPAENLYRSMGFVPTGERKPLPSDASKDEVRMVRRLRGATPDNLI